MSIITDLTALIGRIVALEQWRRTAPYYRWGVVTGLSPLEVRYDISTTALPGSPATVVHDLTVGARVFIVIQNRRATIIGRN